MLKSEEVFDFLHTDWISSKECYEMGMRIWGKYEGEIERKIGVKNADLISDDITGYVYERERESFFEGLRRGALFMLGVLLEGGDSDDE